MIQFQSTPLTFCLALGLTLSCGGGSDADGDDGLSDAAAATAA
jgi:hypothetical protein